MSSFLKLDVGKNKKLTILTGVTACGEIQGLAAVGVGIWIAACVGDETSLFVAANASTDNPAEANNEKRFV